MPVNIWTPREIYDKNHRFIIYNTLNTGLEDAVSQNLKNRVVIYSESHTKWELARHDTQNLKTKPFSFCFARHPYEKILESFFYLRDIKCIPQNSVFKDWIINADIPVDIKNKQTSNSIAIIINKYLDLQKKSLYNQKIDYIIKYESINEDWELVSTRLKIPFKKIKIKPRFKKSEIKSLYSHKSKEKVDEIYEDDFKYFNYSMNF